MAEKEQKDIDDTCGLNQNGISGHLLTGHGPELEHFERRDIGTTHLMSYRDKLKADQITDSYFYTIQNTGVDKKMVNTQASDLNIDPKDATQGGLKPKHYGEFTKKCDKNYLKLGLRK